MWMQTGDSDFFWTSLCPRVYTNTYMSPGNTETPQLMETEGTIPPCLETGQETVDHKIETKLLISLVGVINFYFFVFQYADRQFDLMFTDHPTTGKHYACMGYKEE